MPTRVKILDEQEFGEDVSMSPRTSRCDRTREAK